MGFNLKMFDTMGAITLVTAPSMMNPGEISFFLMNLKEEQKNQFAKQLNDLFPKDNVVVYIYTSASTAGWINQAKEKSKFIIVDKTNLPIWINELLPENKVHEFTGDQSVESIFQNIKKTYFSD